MASAALWIWIIVSIIVVGLLALLIISLIANRSHRPKPTLPSITAPTVDVSNVPATFPGQKPIPA